MSHTSVDNLFNAARSGCHESREELIIGFMPIVKRIAQKHARAGITPDELMADGYLALNDAIETFSGVDGFQNYAVRSISNAIKNSDLLFGVITIPQHMKRFIRYKKRCEAALLDLRHRNPTRLELLDYMVEHDRSTDGTLKRRAKYDRYLTLTDGECLPNLVSEFEEAEQRIFIEQATDMISRGLSIPLSDITQNEQMDLIIALVERFMTPDEQLILFHSYGFNGYEKLRAKEIRLRLAKPIAIQTISAKKKKLTARIESYFAA